MTDTKPQNQKSLRALRRINTKSKMKVKLLKKTQYSVITYMGKESEKEWIYVCITESLCFTPETNAIL